MVGISEKGQKMNYVITETYRDGHQVEYIIDAGRQLKLEALRKMAEAIGESHRANVEMKKQAVSVAVHQSDAVVTFIKFEKEEWLR